MTPEFLAIVHQNGVNNSITLKVDDEILVVPLPDWWFANRSGGGLRLSPTVSDRRFTQARPWQVFLKASLDLILH